jgi:hypothetical protein
MLFHTVSLIREANAEFHRLLSAAVESGSESGVVRGTRPTTKNALIFFFFFSFPFFFFSSSLFYKE